MKKIVFYAFGAIFSLLLLFVGYLLMNPPLDTNSATFHSPDYKTIIIPIGNKGMSKITDIEVEINSQRKPNDSKIQVIDYPEGAFHLSFDTEVNVFKELEGFKLPTGTNVQKRLDSNEQAPGYGLTVRAEFPINHITMKYRYLGIPYSEDLLMQ